MTVSAFLLKGRGESLGLFSCALFRPGGGHVKGSRPGLELLAVRATAAVDTDGVRNQFAGLVTAFLDVSHIDSSLPCRAGHDTMRARIDSFE